MCDQGCISAPTSTPLGIGTWISIHGVAVSYALQGILQPVAALYVGTKLRSV